ncbi:CxC2 domain-containing protein [Mycena sanguinolenta]|uniref:CxC2 domain-containing protein n=1 Tax=Mycena sanguinolenta TaxID=230812 RepID=A0A8H6ZG88_9AGAR|nr:CxC2 domain-containing protein [Mycena sanguinolenta]
MGDGVGYFCKRYGDDGYYEYVSKHADETKVSNCSGFQAMSLANTKHTKGLRSTGVAGVTCSRHNMWRPNGIGDLQVGERQCNVDFVLLAALIGLRLLWLIISYDIACQFAINFWSCMTQLLAHMQLTIEQKNVWWKVPNFHLPDHKPKCHSPYSFHWMWGAGMSHGEGIEQNWSFSNGTAASTRLMGPGSRQATLEDIFGFHNYNRTLAMRGVPTRCHFPPLWFTSAELSGLTSQITKSFSSQW